jgi:hypothetical protein
MAKKPKPPAPRAKPRKRRNTPARAPARDPRKTVQAKPEHYERGGEQVEHHG